MSDSGLRETRKLAPLVLVTGLVLMLLAAAVRPLEAQTGDVANDLTLAKSGTLDVGVDMVATPGDVITYELVVGNSGTQCSIDDITVSDPKVSPVTCPSGNPISSLATAAMETCTGTYAITQADINLGRVANQATASGRVCSEVPTVANDDDLVMIEQVNDLTLTKAGVLDLGSDGVTTVGDIISYELVVGNAGNVPLFDVTLSDPNLSTITCPSGNPIPELAPGASETCTGEYAITQADIDAGVKENVAEAVADTLEGRTAVRQPQVTATAATRVMIPAPMPTLGGAWLSLLALALAGAGLLALRRRSLVR